MERDLKKSKPTTWIKYKLARKKFEMNYFYPHLYSYRNPCLWL
jgi:hypothetical protein